MLELWNFGFPRVANPKRFSILIEKQIYNVRVIISIDFFGMTGIM